MSLEQGLNYFNDRKYLQAFKILGPLAGRGDKQAQYIVGKCFEEGFAVPKNFLSAMEWYERAASEGQLEAIYSLGCLLGRGDSESDFKPNREKASYWFSKAAKEGHVKARENKAQKPIL